MDAMCKPIFQKSGTGPLRPLLTGTLAFCSALTLAFSAPGIAEEVPNSAGDHGIIKEEAQAFIDAVTLKIKSSPSTRAWRNNTSVITQIGNANRARVKQVRNRSFAYGNYAKAYQYGNSNEASIIQSGGNNIGLIGQIGNDHQASIKQTGNNFDAHINQNGVQSSINISQSGNGLRSISVSQSAHSGAAAPVTIRTN